VEKRTTLEEAAFELATRQDGVATNAQLVQLGLTQRQIERWLASGWLQAVHRSVYAVGHRRTDGRAQRQAALLAVGELAALFRLSAAAHLDLHGPEPEISEVVAGPLRQVRRPGIFACRSRTVDPELDIVSVNGLRSTTVARTLVDLASVLARWQLQRAAERAAFQGRLSYPAVADALRRAGGPKGAAMLREVLGADLLDAAIIGSGFEREVLEGLLAAGVRKPVLQRPFRMPDGQRMLVDFCWPKERLVVEVDGPHHEHDLFARKDAARDACLTALRYRVIRVSHRRWNSEPARVLAEIAAALAER
jgi:hypothetical protein